MNPFPLVTFSEFHGKAVFSFLQSIHLADSESIREQIRQRLRTTPYRDAIFRMDQVHYIDSSGLGLFVALRHEFRATTRFRFSGLNPNVKLVFEFSNLLNYFLIDETIGQTLSVPVPQGPGVVEVEQPPRPEFLAVEAKYFLTEAGIHYCTQRQIPIRDIRLYRGALVSGFTWANVNPALLERFVTHGLLKGMEMERTEFLDRREEILRLTEVLFDGIAMKRFRPLLKLTLMKDETYRQLAAHGVTPETLRGALKSHGDEISTLKAEIVDLVLQRAPGTAKVKAERLMGLVDESVWFLLTRNQASEGNRLLRYRVLDALVSYLGRLDLSGSIALNLMEFMQQAERAHFLNLAVKDPFTRKNPQAIPELLADSAFRERLIAKAKLQKESLVLNINFDGNPHNSRQGLVVEITVRNKGTTGNQLRNQALVTKSFQPATEDWEDRLLQEAAEGLDGMSLLNLNALKDLCQAQGIVLETDLVKDQRTDETVASMRLVL